MGKVFIIAMIKIFKKVVEMKEKGKSRLSISLKKKGGVYNYKESNGNLRAEEHSI